MAEDFKNPFIPWTTWVIKTGITTITGIIGVAYLARAYFTFDLNVAAVGVILVVVGALIEYLIFSKEIAYAIAQIKGVSELKPPKRPGPKED